MSSLPIDPSYIMKEGTFCSVLSTFALRENPQHVRSSTHVVFNRRNAKDRNKKPVLMVANQPTVTKLYKGNGD
jgi:hypothetical protein